MSAETPGAPSTEASAWKSQAYEVHLEMFEGPLDLLLYLIKKNDLDVQNIPISQITQEYLGYLDLMKELNLDLAGDFLVMASTLMQIKAQTLLPSPPALEEGVLDAQSELVARLLEYQKFKGAGNFLSARAAEFSGVFYRGAPHFAEHEKSLNIRIFDLLTTLKEVLDRAEDKSQVVIGEEFRIEDKIRKILALLEKRPYVRLIEIFEGEHKRMAIIACFMALLELVKVQQVFARQDVPFGDILVYKKEAADVAPLWPVAEEAHGKP